MGYEWTELRDLEMAFQSIQEESSRNEKEELLKAYEEMPYFTDALYFLYNNMITTGISKKKLANKNFMKPLEGITPLDNFGEMLEYLKRNNTGRGVDLATIHSLISNYTDDPAIVTMLHGVVTKDIPLGISATTINKVYGKNFVPKFDVMKGEKFEKHEKKLLDADGNLKVTHAVTTKLDGNRCVIIINEEGAPTFMARSGKAYEGLGELASEIDKLGWEGVVLDGEIIAENPEGLDSKTLFSKTQKIIRSKEEYKTGLEFYIYDIVPLQEFMEGKSTKIYEQRREELLNIEEEIVFKNLERLKVLPVHFYTKDMSKIQSLAAQVTDEGKEGLMLNAMNGYYVTKRTNQLLKLKKFYTVDLRCTGVIEEIRGGRLGAIEVDYKGYKVKVGTGFSDAQRKLYWENPDMIVGKIVEVGFFEETTNDNGGISLRFPAFKRVREKDEVSYD